MTYTATTDMTFQVVLEEDHYQIVEIFLLLSDNIFAGQ